MKSYYIKRNKVDISPEEVLIDEYTKRNGEANEKLAQAVNQKKIQKFFYFGIFLFLILIGRLFFIGVVEGKYYSYRAKHNRIRYFYFPAPRGNIYDRYGNALTENVPSYSLVMIPYDLPRDKVARANLIKTVAQTMKIDIKEIKKYLTNPNINPLEPILIKQSLEVDEVRKLETQIEDNQGFRIIKDSSRYYPYGEAFAHVLGYLGKMGEKELQEYPNYNWTTIIGKDGLEKQYEGILQGKMGKKLIEVDAQYNIIKELGAIPAVKGNDIVTTLDKDLQLYFYKKLKQRVQELGITKGVGIALNPHSGEVLALVNIPSFDPNVLTQGRPPQLISKYLTDKSHPLFNRAIAGLYPPGSTIKPLMAIAALEEKIISPNKKIYDSGEIVIPNPYHPEIKYIFKDWKKHGWVDLRRAIAVSCNYYFWVIGGGYQDMKGLGWKKIKKYWQMFRLDKKLGIDLPGENQSVLPDPEWLEKTRTYDPVWRLGDTYNISIGEGEMLLTPLQMIAYISTIANNGLLMKPHLVQEIRTDPVKKIFPAKITRLPVALDNLKIVQQGMRMVVTEGTATSLNSLPIEVAGKSGSPKFMSAGKAKYHAIFIGYAPYKNPQIAILVLLENPPQGSLATIPVVQDVLQWYWENRISQNNLNKK